jgi:hypothetical protein
VTEPERFAADARKAGISDHDLDCAVDVIAATDAGIMQSLNIRAKAEIAKDVERGGRGVKP